jgi:integrin beta 3
VATFLMIVLAVVGTPVVFFVIREAVQDPVFAELDGWNLPGWATTSHSDEAYGSRWCIRECRFRERTWQAAKGPEETNTAYASALRDAGWTPWHTAGCPAAGVEGIESCWQRDEYVLNLWVRAAPCEVRPVRPTVGADGSAAATPPGAAPSASGAPGTDAGGIPGPGCGTALATVKVFNRIAYQQVA